MESNRIFDSNFCIENKKVVFFYKNNYINIKNDWKQTIKDKNVTFICNYFLKQSQTKIIKIYH